MTTLPLAPVPNLGIGFDGDRRFELLVDAVTDYAIYLLDPQGRVASWNRGAHNFKGYTADEIIGQHFSVFYTDEDRATGLPERALATAATEGKFEQEGWRVRKDGSHFWTSVVIDPVRSEDGTLIGYAKITRDITDKLEAARELRESEQRFRLLVQGVRDYAIYLLDPNGIVTNWNAGAALIKGYTADEVVGTHFSRFYTPEDQAAGEPARALQTALTEGKYETESWRQRKDGTRFRAGVLIDPIYDGGKLIGFAKVTRDLTERWKAQQEMQVAREALAQAQKMEAIGRLTGGVAHDFNNLLTVIRASADLLRRPEIPEAKRQRYIQAIAETAERAALLTGQLLAFARRQPLQPERFDIAARLAGMGHIIGTTLGSPVSISYKIDADVGAVDADPNQFETAVLNMAINARDAMPGGGTLRISARRAYEVPAVRRHAAVAGAFVAVSVQDDGTGIDADTLSRIFEPFFTTKDVNKGTGLGLSQVYGFAKQSGGEVAVESVVGAGSCFTLYLPRADNQDAILPPRPAETLAAGTTRQAILMVEDNEVVGGFSRTLLEELGQDVTWATGGEEALQILGARPDAFDVVFSDVVMPGMNGIELAQEIRRRWPALPVVLTSGYSHILAEEGSHGFELLQKPYSVEGLLAVLRGSRASSG